jgi:hypothetical protein
MMTEMAGPVCDTGCETLIALLLVLLAVAFVCWVAWVPAGAWWLESRGWRTRYAWPTAAVVVVGATWTVASLLYLEALAPLRGLGYVVLAGPVAAVVAWRRRRQRGNARADDS